MQLTTRDGVTFEANVREAPAGSFGRNGMLVRSEAGPTPAHKTSFVDIRDDIKCLPRDWFPFVALSPAGKAITIETHDEAMFVLDRLHSLPLSDAMWGHGLFAEWFCDLPVSDRLGLLAAAGVVKGWLGDYRRAATARASRKPADPSIAAARDANRAAKLREYLSDLVATTNATLAAMDGKSYTELDIDALVLLAGRVSSASTVLRYHIGRIVERVEDAAA